MENEKIKKILQSISDEPGVYLMKDSSGAIIYIGKASSLKKRVNSYFQKKDHDPKTRILVKNIDDIECIITDSEIEALIFESNLIKKHKPKFNIRMKDDKRYPYIAVKFDEEYPRVIYTRKIVNPVNRYFGPYTDSRAAKNTMYLINNLFKLKTCRRDLPLKSNERPCMNFQIGKCGGVCAGVISKEEYLALIDNAVKFLDGNIDPVIMSLQEMMKNHSIRMEFEKAKYYRDMIFDIQKISETQKVDLHAGFDQDYIAVSSRLSEAIVILFEFRKGLLLGRKISVFDNAEYSTENEIIRSFIVDYYSRSEIPQRIINKSGVEDKELLENYLSAKSSRKVSIIHAASQEDKGIINLILKNIDIIFADRSASEIYDNRLNGLSELKKILNLKEIPDIIECFDMSNIQGTNATASMVVFSDGLPDKSSYRRFKIRGYEGANDPGMIHEAVARHIQHLVNEVLELPKLIVIDGGITQLARAIEAASNFDVDIKIISLAKKLEEIYISPELPPVRLQETSPALHILQNIRDEAHRFAVTYHRKLRAKSMTASELDDIPDIGEKIRNLLIKKFKSLENIKNASLEELESVDGIGKKTAKKISEYFQEHTLSK
jgi:excinuclease ABC subunit C